MISIIDASTGKRLMMITSVTSNHLTKTHEDEITANQVYQIFEKFDKMYSVVTDLDKIEFFGNFIESIELYPEKRDDGRIVRQISFKIPVFYKP